MSIENSLCVGGRFHGGQNQGTGNVLLKLTCLDKLSAKKDSKQHHDHSVSAINHIHLYRLLSIKKICTSASNFIRSEYQGFRGAPVAFPIAESCPTDCKIGGLSSLKLSLHGQAKFSGMIKGVGNSRYQNFLTERNRIKRQKKQQTGTGTELKVKIIAGTELRRTF